MDEKSFANKSEQSTGTGAATAAAPATERPIGEADAGLVLKDWVNNRIVKHPNLTMSYQGQDVTVIGLRHNGIRGRDETGADVLIPLEENYLKELFTELVNF
jgi:hypothetical protein